MNMPFILFSLFLAQLSSVLDFLIILPLGPVFMKEFQIGPQQFSLLVSAFSVACSISGIICFRYVDRFDRKTLFITALGFFFLSNIWCSMSDQYESLLIARIFTGLAGGLLEASIFSVIADVFPVEKRGRAVGIVATGFAVASFAGIPIGILIENAYGWRKIFDLIALIALIGMFSSFFALPKLRSHIAAPQDAQLKEKLIRRFFSEPKLRGGIFLTATVMFAIFLLIPFIASALVLNGGISQTDLSTVYMVGGAAAFISTPFIGKLTDSLGRWRMYSILSPLGAVAVSVIILLHDVTVFQACVAIVFSMALNSGRNVVTNTIITDLPEPRLRASYMSLKGAVQNAAAGLGTFVAGCLVTESGGKLSGLWAVAILSCILTLCSLPMAKRLTTS